MELTKSDIQDISFTLLERINNIEIFLKENKEPINTIPLYHAIRRLKSIRRKLNGFTLVEEILFDCTTVPDAEKNLTFCMILEQELLDEIKKVKTHIINVIDDDDAMDFLAITIMRESKHSILPETKIEKIQRKEQMDKYFNLRILRDLVLSSDPLPINRDFCKTIICGMIDIIDQAIEC